MNNTMSKMKIKGRWAKSKTCSPVYERADGVRIHTYGLVRTIAGETMNVDHDVLKRFLKITGGNRRRAMMLTANEMVKI